MTGISCHPDIEYAQIPGFRPLELDLYLRIPRRGIASPGVDFWDGADDVPGLVARSADFAHSLAPLEV